jgi:hypothetical protein
VCLKSATDETSCKLYECTCAAGAAWKHVSLGQAETPKRCVVTRTRRISAISASTGEGNKGEEISDNVVSLTFFLFSFSRYYAFVSKVAGRRLQNGGVLSLVRMSRLLLSLQNVSPSSMVQWPLFGFQGTRVQQPGRAVH